ncbi:MAG: pilus assembly protein PilP [Calditrichaeota bacterium]|nr:pilus assembly protein PilP [Calditrichota bacterium]
MSHRQHGFALFHRKEVRRILRRRDRWIRVLVCFFVLLALEQVAGQDAIESADGDVSGKMIRMAPDSSRKAADSLTTSPTPEVVSPSNTTKRTATYRSVLRREKTFTYDAGGRRDPFRPLIVEGKRGQEVVTSLLQLDGAVLTGVVWSEGEYLAMVRDKHGKNFFLREGDPVFRGHVVSVSQTKAVFQLAEFGAVERVTLTVRAKEDKTGSQ